MNIRRIEHIHLPREGGTYLLVLQLHCRIEIEVGRLGRIRFQRGWYAYAGSAFGPGGLAARVGRHLVPSTKKHWHIDYLRVQAQPVGVWITPEPAECVWAAALSSLPGAGLPIPGFGASDCRLGCTAHLVYFSTVHPTYLTGALQTSFQSRAPVEFGLFLATLPS